MVQTADPSIVPLIIVGTSVMLLLVGFIFLFVIMYQRKMINHQAELQKLQQQKQRELLQAVFDAQENERKRLADDLHDSVGQVLSTIKLNVHRLEALYKSQTGLNGTFSELLVTTRHLADESIQEIRHIVQNVLPPLLTDFGLLEALTDLCAKINASISVQVSFHHADFPVRLSHEIELGLFRIVQELFSNALKYAQATRIDVSLLREGDAVCLTFRDNGVGFEVSQPRENGHNTPKGHGLVNIASRVHLMKGNLCIDSQPSQGTTVKVKVSAIYA